MNFQDSINTAFLGIKRNKVRSLLTMLGIIIGVGSVILMISIGNSFEYYILHQVDEFGGDLLEIYPAGLERFGKSLDSITYEDYSALNKLNTLTNVAPFIVITEKAFYKDEETTPSVYGTNGYIFENFALKIETGRFLNNNDFNGAKRNAVIGFKIAEDLFKELNPINKKIRLGKNNFRVVGVLQNQESLLMSSLNSIIVVPFQTAKAVSGKTRLDYISAKAVGDPELAIADVTSLLRQRHKINNPEKDMDKDDFIIRSSEQSAEIIGTVSLGISIFLALIAGISLIVGGIGIMNIMLVTVTERTKEIGLRKAVGATRKNILAEFILEALILTFSGAIIGIVSGSLLGFLAAKTAELFLGEIPYSLSFGALLTAVSMAAIIGLIFGVYPAKKAADLNPIEALRKE